MSRFPKLEKIYQAAGAQDAYVICLHAYARRTYLRNYIQNCNYIPKGKQVRQVSRRGSKMSRHSETYQPIVVHIPSLNLLSYDLVYIICD